MTPVTLSLLRTKINTSRMDHDKPSAPATETSTVSAETSTVSAGTPTVSAGTPTVSAGTSTVSATEPVKEREGISAMNLALIMGGVTIGIAATIVGSAVFLRSSLRESIVDLSLEFKKVLSGTLLRTSVDNIIRVRKIKYLVE